jgi:hypothetical protein
LKKLPKGLQEAIYGIMGAIIIGAVMKAFAENNLIPSYLVWSFTIAGILGNIATIKSLQVSGTAYTIGWLIGGLMLKDVLEPADFIVYIVAPSVILALRLWQFLQYIRNYFR